MKRSKGHLLFCLPSFSGGGAERFSIILADYLYNDGYEITFVVNRCEGPLIESVSKEYQIFELRGDRKGGISLVKAIIQFRKIVRGKNAPLVIFSNMRKMNIFTSLSLSFLRNKPKLSLREASPLIPSETFKGRWREFLYLTLMRLSYRSAINIIANSNGTKQSIVDMLKIPSQLITRIYNPVDLKGIDIQSRIKEPNIPHSDLIACGRLHPSKNFVQLIEALAILKSKGRNYKLVILGEGPQREELEKLAKSLDVDSLVCFAGFVNNPYAYFKSSRLFVQTSKWEGFGFVLVEAMACGLPSVVFEGKGAIKEVTDNGKFSRLIKQGDVEGFTEAIIEEIENPSKYDFSLNLNRFKLEVVCRQYKELLELR